MFHHISLLCVYTPKHYDFVLHLISPTFGYRSFDNTVDDHQPNERVEKHRRIDCSG